MGWLLQKLNHKATMPWQEAVARSPALQQHAFGGAAAAAHNLVAIQPLPDCHVSLQQKIASAAVLAAQRIKICRSVQVIRDRQPHCQCICRVAVLLRKT